MKKWSILIMSLVLAGCAETPVARMSGPLFDDAAFNAPSEQIGAERLFTLTPQMRDFLAKEIAPQTYRKGSQEALYEALYAQGQLKLDYDSARTRTASEAFDARSGNCLSMAIMTAAFAKELGMRVQYKQIFVDEVWNRIGQTYFSIGHVNVTLLEKPPLATMVDLRRPMTIDFIPVSELQHHRSEVIEEDTIVAMYMNNRAAESLAEGKLDNAYAWARAAVKQDPSFPSSYNTLGVIYRSHGNLANAERAFREALVRKSDDVVAMSNLSQTLAAVGQLEESKRLAERVERLQPYPPYHFFNLGMTAMKEGDYHKAKGLFKKEIERAPLTHEFQFWYAVASYRLGEIETAKRHMTLAMENSITQSERGLYAAKLDQLTTMRRLDEIKQTLQ